MQLLLIFLKVYFNSVGLLFPKNSVKRLSNLFATPRRTVIRHKEIEILKQATGSSLSSGDYTIHLYEWGTGSNYALLCHGWESNAGSLGAMVNPLLEKGLRVIAFDGPAHGKSSGEQANLLKFKNGVLSIMEEKGTPSIAIGHSLGANAIMLAAAETNLNIDKTILFAPVNKVSKVFLEFKGMIGIPDSLYRDFIKDLEEKSGYLLSDLNFEDIAPKTSLKEVLIMHDKMDQITPVEHSIDIDSRWESSTFVPINGSGHYKILWNESAINEVKQFIN